MRYQGTLRINARSIKRKRLWIAWAIATTLGGLIGLIAGFWFLGPLALVGAGLGLGIAQWLVLRGLFEAPFQWLLLTTAGGVLSAFIAFASLDWLDSTTGLAVGTVIVGAVIGTLLNVPQWLVLRGPFTRAGWWIAVGAAAGAISVLVAGVIVRTMGPFEGGSILIAGVVAWLLYGVLSSTGLVWLVGNARD